MDLYPKYKSPLGYEIGDDGIDSYGVDHSGFSTRDELEYQVARQQRENQLMQNYNSQGITQDYPQYGTDFWGDNTDNNYGFGCSDISGNIANVTNMLDNSGQGFDTTNQTHNLSDSDCYMTFNGQNLNLYNNTGQVGSLNAQSGRDDYQSAQYQNVLNKGPIPEGTYYADQNQRQSLTPENIALKTAEKLGINTNQKSSWSGNPISWGTKRVWLRPDINTNTYGRSGFSIHGGLTKGSAGCIDIPWQTGKLSDYLDDCQDSIPVYVKYPKNW